jgi:hypothetical protein
MGGGGVWNYISSSVTNASNFASAVVVCGVTGISNVQNIVNSKIAIWAFHAKDDKQVGVGSTTGSVSLINNAGPVVPAYMTIYETGDHYIWGRVYDPNGRPGVNNETVNIHEWAEMNEVGKPVAVPRLGPATGITAKAGLKISTRVYYNDTVVTTPLLNLDGNASTGLWKSAGWRAATVPQGVGMWEPIITSGGGWITGTASLPAEGIYTFELTLKDADGKETKDNLVITYKKDGTVTPPTPKRELGRIFVPKLNIYIVIYDDGTTGSQ